MKAKRPNAQKFHIAQINKSEKRNSVAGKRLRQWECEIENTL